MERDRANTQCDLGAFCEKHGCFRGKETRQTGRLQLDFGMPETARTPPTVSWVVYGNKHQLY